MRSTLNRQTGQESSYRYPGMTFVSQALSANSSRRVLDLGSASAASFNFFMRKSCTVRFENVSQYVSDQLTNASSSDTNILRASLEDYLSGFRSHEKFDVVLTWDLFNYLDLETISWLMGRLGQYCHDQSLLHSIRYTEPTRFLPKRYQVVSEHEIKLQALGVTDVYFGQHALSELVHSLPFYYLETRFDQVSGMPEGVSEEVYRFSPSKRNTLRHQSKLATPEVQQDVLPGLEHRSYALESLCEHLMTIESPRILDLGAQIETNAEFYGSYSNNVVFAGLYDKLQHLISPADLLSSPDLLNCQSNEKFDVIFAWGLFGCCSPEQLQALKQRLLPHMHSNTKIHVVIYAGHTEPVDPDKYHIKNIHTVYLPATQDYCSTNPPVTAIRLLKILGDASYENSFIMKPGMAPNFFEHILVLQKPQPR